MSQKKHAQGKRKTARAGIVLTLVILAGALAAMVLLSTLVPTPDVSSVTSVNPDTGEVSSTSLHITEIMASNQAAFPDERGNFSDWVELTNTSDQPIGLNGFGLSDREDKILFTFPNQILKPGERVVVFCSDESNSTPGQPFHAPFKISSAGETLILFSPEGSAVERIVVPALGHDMVYTYTSNGWIVSDMFTPGYPNTQQGLEEFRSSTHIEAGALIINELVPSNRTTLMDEDGEFSDWIELYNTTGRAIDLSNYALSDNPEKRVKWRFPQGTVIEPRGYYLVFASGKDKYDGAEGHHPHTNFGLSAEKGTLLLSDIQGRLVDMASYDLVPTDAAWGRRESGDRPWQIFNHPTPGLANNHQGALEMNRQLMARNPVGVVITEVMSSNVNTTLPSGLTGVDWVELFNFSNQAVDLSGYGLSDSISRPRKWQFPAGVVIGAGQYLLVACDGTGTPTKNGDLRTSYRVSSAGETMCLSDPQGNILDKLVVPQLLPDITYGRTPGQDGLFYYAQPTPGAHNSQGFAGFAEPPTFITQGGMFDRPITVELNVPEGYEVRYTTDASDPTVTSPVYTGPIEIPHTTVIRARGFAPGLNPSTIATQTYFISVYHTTPVISLVTDPDHVWNAETGMLAKGPLEGNESVWRRPWFDVDKHEGVGKDGLTGHLETATYAKKLHYDGSMEFYETDGKQVLSTGMDFHVMGQFSLDMPQKSFSVNAKKRFGTGYFEYKLFPDLPYERYKAIALRNGGQDGLYTRVLDGMQARLAATMPGTTVLTQAWRPVSVYLNGQYWGHYNMRERINRHFVAQHEGWENPDAMDLLEASGTSSSNICWGSNRDYKDLLNHIENLDMTQQENIQYIIDRVDIDNMFDYFIFEMYIGNTDPGNIRYYKKHGEGNKWKWILYDMDWGLFDSKSGGPEYVLNPKGMGAFRINNLLLRKTLENPDMRNKFLERMGFLFQTTFTAANIGPMLDAMVEEIKPEQTMHQGRWAEEMPKEVSFDVPKHPEGAYNYWLQRVARAHNVINKRPNIFWGKVQDFFGLSDGQMERYFGSRPLLPPDPQ